MSLFVLLCITSSSSVAILIAVVVKTGLDYKVPRCSDV